MSFELWRQTVNGSFLIGSYADAADFYHGEPAGTAGAAALVGRRGCRGGITGRRERKTMKESESMEVIMVPEEDSPQYSQPGCPEYGVEIPFERISPTTLRNLVAEFVTREWEELGDSGYTLDDKIRQVLEQLQEKKAKVVFDLETETCNIVSGEPKT